MDTNNFKNSLRELTSRLMATSASTLNYDDVNAVLQYAIQHNLVADTEVRVFVTALEAFKLELPYFTVLQLSLINELFIYGFVLGEDKSKEIQEETSCCCPTPMINKTPNETVPSKNQEEEKIDLSPAAIAASAGMYHKEIQVDPGSHTKHIRTYEHLADGTTRLVSEETLTEPQEEDIFANILGDSFEQDFNSPQVTPNDL